MDLTQHEIEAIREARDNAEAAGNWRHARDLTAILDKVFRPRSPLTVERLYECDSL